MKSRANFRGHPLHPIFIVFPVAFLTGTLLFDVLGLITGNIIFQQTGIILEISGILSALVAAVPGFIDYFFTVPPKSTAKKRATKHMIFNLTAVAIFFIAFLLRQNKDLSLFIILAIEAAGFIMLSIAGWMGGTLVHRNQIGIDPRYADAGKWKEEYFKETAGKIMIGNSEELKLNQMKLLHIGKKRIVLGRSEKGYVAFDDRCTHRGGSLAGGSMICGTVQCPWHGSQFDVYSGSIKAGPAKESIITYQVTEENDKVFINL
jgi:nitrite reductase/ring-hydroxylating ferredoxin subunit/uncharacterized membrane protein